VALAGARRPTSHWFPKNALEGLGEQKWETNVRLCNVRLCNVRLDSQKCHGGAWGTEVGNQCEVGKQAGRIGMEDGEEDRSGEGRDVA
jgi:hypothetical protein